MLRFFLQVSAGDSAVNVNFFALCTQCNFFHSSLLMIQRRGENQAYQYPFLRLNSIPHSEKWTQLYLILSVLLLTFTHITAILRGQVTVRKDARRKNPSKMHVYSPTCFSAICFFCGIVCSIDNIVIILYYRFPTCLVF